MSRLFYNTSRLRFIRFSKPDAIVTSFHDGFTSSYPWGIPNERLLNPTRTPRSIAPSGISSTPSRGGCACRLAFVLCYALSSGFRTVSLEFSACPLRGSRKTVVSLPRLRGDVPGYILLNKWPDGGGLFVRRAGCQNATSTLSFEPYETDSFFPNRHAPAK